MKSPSEPPPQTDETIDSIAELERRAEESLSTHQRRIERATTLIGRPRTVYVIAGCVAVWIAVNFVLATHGRAFDPPPFALMSGTISLAALLMTILILTTENRLTQHAARRDRLDLQINLLTERKISKAIEMLEALRRDSPTVPNRHDPEARELGRATNSETIARAFERPAPDTEAAPP